MRLLEAIKGFLEDKENIRIYIENKNGEGELQCKGKRKR